MTTKTEFGTEAKEKLLKGLDELANAVVATLGPKGRNVAIGQKHGMPPRVVHDGVTVAKSINPEDPFENMGASLIREAASKTNDSSGDGTTTATLIAQKIVKEGLKSINAGANPMILKKGIDKAVSEVVAEIKKMAKPIKSSDEVRQIATVSAQNEEIGRLITEAIEKVGKDGVTTVEEGNGLNIEVEYKKGMEFDRGWVSPYFVTNPDKMEAEVKNANILITDKKITSFETLLPLIENIMANSEHRSLVVIADGIEGEALAGLVINKLQGKLAGLAVQAPGFGDRRKDLLQDLAIVTGATIISDELGRTLEEVTMDDLGKADKVWASKDLVRIIGGKGNKKDINVRIQQLKRNIKDATAQFEKEKLQERLAKLTGGVAIISVGAASESELGERKERVIDAVEATKSAREEGVVVGGGIALFKARISIDLTSQMDDDEREGKRIVLNALAEPLRQIIKNCGEDDRHILRELEKVSGKNIGYDAITGEITDLIKRGVIDPAKVTRSVLQNGASVASMILTTEVLVGELPEARKEENDNR